MHHSLSPDRDEHLPDSVSIKRFHTSYRHYGDIITKAQYDTLKAQGKAGLSIPWAGVGYHWLIEKLSDGDYWVLQGRSMMMSGAHTRGMNSKAIGVCAIGSFDDSPPPEAQFEKAAEHVAWLCRMYRIPVENVKGHRDYASYKSCPGTQFDMDYFRERVEDWYAKWQT